jgi:hypothetical protein
MFFVIIRVTSCRSLLSLSSPEPPAAFAARVSWYNRAVFDMNVSEQRESQEYGGRHTQLMKPSTESNKCVRFANGFHFWPVCGCKLFGQLIKIRECEFSRVRFFGYSKEYDIICYEVTGSRKSEGIRPASQVQWDVL